MFSSPHSKHQDAARMVTRMVGPNGVPVDGALYDGAGLAALRGQSVHLRVIQGDDGFHLQTDDGAPLRAVNNWTRAEREEFLWARGHRRLDSTGKGA